MSTLKAIKLVSINEDGKLTLHFDKLLKIHPNTKIISIVGTGKNGKSSLLNSIISFLMKSNFSVFTTSNTDECGTNGIDAFHLFTIESKTSYLFLDCQGILRHQIQHDTKLLLISYLLSSVMIFNENGIIDNSTLKSFEPLFLCNFLSNIKKETKTNLVFRVRDYNLKTPISNSFDKLLKPYGDHFDSIKGGIKNLFDDISIVATFPMDRSVIKNINEGEYLSAISDHDSGYKQCIESILQICSKSSCVDINIVQQFEKYIDEINSNIQFNNIHLDTYSLVIKTQIDIFMNSLNKDIFTPIELKTNIKDMDEIFHRFIQPRITSYYSAIDKFNEKFNKINPEIYESYLTKFKMSVVPIINNAIIEVYLKFLKSNLDGMITAFGTRILTFSSESHEDIDKKIKSMIDERIETLNDDLEKSIVSKEKNGIHVNIINHLKILKNVICSAYRDECELYLNPIIKIIEDHKQKYQKCVNKICDEISLDDLKPHLPYDKQNFYQNALEKFNVFWTHNDVNSDLEKIKIYEHKLIADIKNKNVEKLEIINFNECHLYSTINEIFVMTKHQMPKISIIKNHSKHNIFNKNFFLNKIIDFLNPNNSNQIFQKYINNISQMVDNEVKSLNHQLSINTTPSKLNTIIDIFRNNDIGELISVTGLDLISSYEKHIFYVVYKYPNESYNCNYEKFIKTYVEPVDTRYVQKVIASPKIIFDHFCIENGPCYLIKNINITINKKIDVKYEIFRNMAQYHRKKYSDTMINQLIDQQMIDKNIFETKIIDQTPIVDQTLNIPNEDQDDCVVVE